MDLLRKFLSTNTQSECNKDSTPVFDSTKKLILPKSWLVQLKTTFHFHKSSKSIESHEDHRISPHDLEQYAKHEKWVEN